MRNKLLQQDLEHSGSRSSSFRLELEDFSLLDHLLKQEAEERQDFYKERVDSKKILNYWGLLYEAICKAIFKREWLPPAIDNLKRMEAVEKINRTLMEFATEEDLIPGEFSR